MSTPTSSLTPEEYKIIADSWKEFMENSLDNGIIIFKTFLEKFNYYSMFPKFSHVPRQELLENQNFIRHTTSIVRALDKTVVLFEKKEDALLEEALEQLGQTHKKRNINENQFIQMKGVILDVLRIELNLPQESVKVWDKFFNISFVHIFQGLKNK